MKIRRPCTAKLPYSMLALALAGLGPMVALAQDSHAHAPAVQNAQLTPDQKIKASELLRKVREATERFQDVEEAERAGYELMFGCVSGDSSGAMGLHYVKMDLVNQGVLDVRYPQIVI